MGNRLLTQEEAVAEIIKPLLGALAEDAAQALKENPKYANLSPQEQMDAMIYGDHIEASTWK